MLDYGHGPTGTVGRSPDLGSAAPTGLAQGAVLRAAFRHKGLILVLALAGAGSGAVMGKVVPPRYVATAQIYIDPRSLPGAGKEDAEIRQDSNGFINYMESQARILSSQLVLDKVAKAQNLADDPNFAGGSRGLLSSWFPAKRMTADEREAAAVQALARHVTVRRPERTFIIEVSASDASADGAARIANGVVDAYTEVQNTLQSDAARQAAEAFSHRLGGLRDALSAAEHRVEDYKAANGLVGDKDFTDEQSLKDLNGQLTLADARLEEARSRFEQMPSPGASDAAVATVAATLNLPTLSSLRAAQAEALQKVADLSMELGPRHPTVQNARARVAEVQRLVGLELARIAQSFRGEFDRAKAADAGLRQKVDVLKHRAMDIGRASIRLGELESEVAADRSMYDSFLARSRQTAESQQLDAANTHVISVATPPQDRSFPPRASMLALLGAAIGAALGFALAIWRSTPAPSASLPALPSRPEDSRPLLAASYGRPGDGTRRAV